ncbi:MAG: hypothetical protein KAI72_06625, partial [Candidatus Pacebacteria bacterium]|nr:hypothetical protein [Candidatus Paceibacterota bacterium]
MLVFSDILSQPIDITLDFETGDLRGWERAGAAFNNQPTFGDNCKVRDKQKHSGHQGNYWIGTFENYQGKQGENPGNTQGDSPTGKLISPIFTIPSGTLSFLVGGGGDRSLVFVELVIIEGTGEFNQKTAFRETGENRETMRRVTWNLNPHSNKQGRIRIVDVSTEPWGHINVDDFKFSPMQKEALSTNRGTIKTIDKLERVSSDKIKLDEDNFKTNLKLVVQNDPPFFIGQHIQFSVEDEVENYHDNMEFQFHYGDGNTSSWIKHFSSENSYENEGTFRAYAEVQIKNKTLAK